MQFYITLDDGGFLRITDENENAITLYLNEGVANILSIFVDEDDRGEGIGTGLLNAAETVCADRGITLIEADYTDVLPDVTSFLEKHGYKLSDGFPILSIAMSDILGNDTLSKTIQRSFKGLRFASLEEIFLMQWEEINAIFTKFSIRLSKNELAKFSQRLSGLVYEESSEAKAVILCSTQEGGLHIDFLGTPGGDSQQYAVATLQGMLLEAIADGGESMYPAITAFCVQDKIEKAFDNIGLSSQKLGKSVYARKELSAGDYDIGSLDIEDDPDDQMPEWIREIKNVPMQSNVCWKAAWHRRHEEKGKGLTHIRNEDNAAPEKKKEEEAKKPAKPAAGKAGNAEDAWESEMRSRYESKPGDVIVSLNEFSALPFAGRNTPEYVVSLEDVSERQFKRGIGNCILNNRMGLIRDPMNISKDDFECEVSSCMITDSRVSGFLLVHSEAEGLLMVDLLFASGPDIQSDVLKLIIRSLNAFLENYPENTGVILRPYNEATEKLVSKLFPGKAGKAGK